MTRGSQKYKIWELIAVVSDTRQITSASMSHQSEAAYTMALNSIMCGTGKPAHVITDPGSQMVSFAEKKKEADTQGLADYEDNVEDTMN